MSFLDEQATGQIGIGEKANLSTLTRRKRKRKKGQNPTGAETYSLMPQNEFSNIVSSPTDITQVGIGEKLQAQGTDASSVGNVFGDYTSAAPIGTTLEAIYYEPPPDDDDDPGDDDDLPSIEDDPMRNFSPDTNIYDTETLTGQMFAEEEASREAFVTTAYQSAFATPMTLTETARQAMQALTGSAGKLGRALEGQDFETHAITQNLTPPVNQNAEAIGADDVVAPTIDVSAPADAAGAGEGYGVGGSGYSGGSSSAGGWTPFASGGTVKVKKSFMSMKGK